MHSVHLLDKFKGSLLGTALGDAVGELAFVCRSKKRLLEVLGQVELLRYTDDTAMALALTESLIENRGLEREALGKRFHQAYLEEPWRGYGPGPPRIFALVEKTGQGYCEAAQKLYRGEGSFGNGAAMRIAPIGLLYHDDEALYEKAALSASVTHAHPVGQDGAAILAEAIAWMIRQKADEKLKIHRLLEHLILSARTAEIREKMNLLRSLLEEEADEEAAARLLGKSVAVQESMPFALYAFLRHPDSFKDCLFTAVLHGGDRDTLGAMAGAAAGAYLGARALPTDWLSCLEDRHKIEEKSRKLFQIKHSSDE